ncbi:hypothetical protein Bca4012_017800 [Brassica carinata]
MADAVESLAKRVTANGFEAKRRDSEMGVTEDAKKWERCWRMRRKFNFSSTTGIQHRHNFQWWFSCLESCCGGRLRRGFQFQKEARATELGREQGLRWSSCSEFCCGGRLRCSFQLQKDARATWSNSYFYTFSPFKFDYSQFDPSILEIAYKSF